MMFWLGYHDTDGLAVFALLDCSEGVPADIPRFGVAYIDSQYQLWNYIYNKSWNKNVDKTDYLYYGGWLSLEKIRPRLKNVCPNAGVVMYNVKDGYVYAGHITDENLRKVSCDFVDFINSVIVIGNTE